MRRLENLSVVVSTFIPSKTSSEFMIGKLIDVFPSDTAINGLTSGRNNEKCGEILDVSSHLHPKE